MGSGFRLGRLAGIEIRAHWSVLVIFWLIATAIGGSYLPDEFPGSPPLVYWLLGLLTALTFIVCLLTHELAHSIVAKRSGVAVKSISLWLFGGISKLDGETSSAGREFRIAVVGPLTSLVIAGLFFAPAAFLEDIAKESPITGAVWWLARINLLLAIFNMMPAFPLDGGRVLHAFLWSRTDASTATRQAARIGRGFGYALVAFGAIRVFTTADLIGGIWLGFIGWFIAGAARAETMGEEISRLAKDLSIDDVMTSDPVVAPGWLRVDEFIERVAVRSKEGTFLLIDASGAVTGLITLALLRSRSGASGGNAKVGDIAIPLDRIAQARAGEPLASVLRRLQVGTDAHVIVWSPTGGLAGLVSPSDLIRALDRQALAGSIARTSGTGSRAA